MGMISLAELTDEKHQKTLIKFEPSCLFIDYAGCDVLSSFFNNTKLLECVIDWLKERANEVMKASLVGPD